MSGPATVMPTLGRVLGTWDAEALPLTGLVLAGALYAAAAVRARERGARWPLARSAAFLAGLVTIAVALCSGIDGYDETLLSLHMVQHLLLLTVAPPLLVWGAPVRLAFATLSRDGRRALARVLRSRAVSLLTRPATGVGVFALVVLCSHFTGLFELALRDPTAHESEHAAYLLAGLMLYAPLIGADPLPHRPGAVGRLTYLTLAMAVMVAPGAWLMFAHGVRYPFYVAPAHALHVSALSDQARAGEIMVFGAGLPMVALKLVLVVRALVQEELRQRRRERYLEQPCAASGADGAYSANGDRRGAEKVRLA